MSVFQLSREEIPTEDTLAALKSAIARLEASGIPIKPGSRFRRYEQRLEELMSAPLGIAPLEEIHAWQFDFREVDELIAIVDSFPKRFGATAQRLLAQMTKGSADPDEETSSQGRDAQWELYLRALLRRAGISASLSEPDVLATIGGRQVPIEAKRPKREDRFDDLLRKGVSQIEATGASGVIAFSLDHAIREGRGLFHGPSVPGLEAEVMRLVRTFVFRQLDRIISRVAERPIMGLAFMARIPCVVGDSEFRLITNGHVETVSNRPTEREILESIRLGLGTG